MNYQSVRTGVIGVAAGLSLAWTAAFAEQVTLEGCIAEALEANPDIRSASARVEAARAAIGEAESARFPRVGVSGTWTRTDNPPQAFFMSLNQRRASLEKDFNNPDDIENARGSVTAQWRLYDSGRREAERLAAQKGAQAAGCSLDSVRNDLVFQVSAAYYGLLQSRAFVAVHEEAVRSLEGHLRVAGERVQAGAALKSDVLNLEVRLSQARDNLIRAQNAVRLALAALNASIGSERVKESDLPDPADRPTARRAAGASDSEARPEWRAVQAQVEAAEALTRRARREYLPVVNAFGSVDWDSEPFKAPERSYLVGAAVEWNIFDGYRTRSGVARASAMLVAAQAEADMVRIRLALDLKRATLNERESRERLDVAVRSLAAAEEALRITRERYQQGAADVTELLTAQLGLTETKARQVAARYDNLIALADIARAAGQAESGKGTQQSGER